MVGRRLRGWLFGWGAWGLGVVAPLAVGCLPSVEDPPAEPAAYLWPPPAPGAPSTAAVGSTPPKAKASWGQGDLSKSPVAIEGPLLALQDDLWEAVPKSHAPRQWKLPVATRPGVKPLAMTVAGVDCGFVEAAPAASGCGVVDGAWAVAGDEPRGVRVELAPELAAREALLRGGGRAGAPFELDGLEVVPVTNRPTRATLGVAAGERTLTVEWLAVESTVFEGNRQFQVEARVDEGGQPMVSWKGEVTAGAGVVAVPLTWTSTGTGPATLVVKGFALGNHDLGPRLFLVRPTLSPDRPAEPPGPR